MAVVNERSTRAEVFMVCRRKGRVRAVLIWNYPMMISNDDIQ